MKPTLDNMVLVSFNGFLKLGNKRLNWRSNALRNKNRAFKTNLVSYPLFMLV